MRDGYANIPKKQGIAIAIGLGNAIRSDVASGTTSVLDYDALIPVPRKAVSEDARNDVAT